MEQFIIIFLLNLLTSIDNAIIIGGMAKKAKHLFVIGAVSAFVITVIRTASIMGVVSIAKAPGLRFSVGVVVLWIAVVLAHQAKPTIRYREPSFGRLLFLITITDLALSIDNILSLAVVSKHTFVVAIAVFTSLLPLLLLLPVIVNVMERIAWLQILVAGFVAELAIDSITDDQWAAAFAPTGRTEILIRAGAAVILILYGIWRYNLSRAK